MPISSRYLTAALISLQLSTSVLADVYMHFPLGANDRNRERNENRNNGNRLYDTQNNAKGGVPWCGNRELQGKWDGFRFYTGSVIKFEWTSQHGQGPDSNVDAQAIIQIACDGQAGSTTAEKYAAAGDPNWKYYTQIGAPAGGVPDATVRARDGYPTGALAESDANNAGQYVQATFQSAGQNGDGTNTIPCPSSIGCQGPNFGGTSLDTDSTQYLAWYDNMTAANAYIPVEFGYHETFQYYLQRCMLTARNRGLYTADQQVNGNDARFSRQSPNGDRDGFECTEESEYYPYWQPSPWMDIAVLVGHSENWQKQCAYYKQESQNVKGRGYCTKKDWMSLITNGRDLPITKDKCVTGDPDANGNTRYDTSDVQWIELPSFGLPAPDCLLAPRSKDNHLGNAVSVSTNGKSYSTVAENPNPSQYSWTVPEGFAGLSCVFRLRYNMSSSDYPQSNWNNPSFKEKDGEKGRENILWNSRFNCPANTEQTAKAGIYNPNLPPNCQNILNESTGYVPFFERPNVQVSTDANTFALAIALQTDQVARTFQDRSYVIKFEKLASRNGRTIINLNNRGRRGNIVQCYPAVENDFYPTNINMGSKSLLHVQFCGSDFNPANNPNNGEGWQYSTRYNLISSFKDDRMRNFPKMLKDGNYVFNNKDVAMKLAFACSTNFTDCVNFQGDNSNTANNDIDNCAKLNRAPAKCEVEPFTVSTGTYTYVATRNNNFSNRSNKGQLSVYLEKDGLSQAAIAGIATAAAVVGLGAAIGGAVFYARKNPHSRVAGLLAGKKGTSTGTAI